MNIEFKEYKNQYGREKLSIITEIFQNYHHYNQKNENVKINSNHDIEQEELLKYAQRQALIPDYDKSSYDLLTFSSLNSKSNVITIQVTKKSLSFNDKLESFYHQRKQENHENDSNLKIENDSNLKIENDSNLKIENDSNLSLNDNDSSSLSLLHEIVIKAINIYLVTLRISFEEQISALPHFSALFYNDCLMLNDLAGKIFKDKTINQQNNKENEIKMENIDTFAVDGNWIEMALYLFNRQLYRQKVDLSNLLIPPSPSSSMLLSMYSSLSSSSLLSMSFNDKEMAAMKMEQAIKPTRIEWLEDQDRIQIKKSIEQSINKISNLERIWTSINIPQGLLNQSLRELYEWLYKWLWDILFLVSDYDKESCDAISLILDDLKILSFSDVSIPSLSPSPSPSKMIEREEGDLKVEGKEGKMENGMGIYEKKLFFLNKIFKWSMLQVQNGFRKGIFKGIIESNELIHYINAIFQVKASQKAFIKEILDESDDETF